MNLPQTANSAPAGAARSLSTAVVIESPEQLALRQLSLVAPEPTDVVVDVHWSGISTGTEKLLFRGEMPPFPGLGYPLVPGYEAVGDVSWAGPEAGIEKGTRVFVPGASCFEEARGLFGANASRLVIPASRAVSVPESLGADAILLALAATAEHALAVCLNHGSLPELIVGHGVLGRLIARLCLRPQTRGRQTEATRSSFRASRLAGLFDEGLAQGH